MCTSQEKPKIKESGCFSWPASTSPHPAFEFQTLRFPRSIPMSSLPDHPLSLMSLMSFRCVPAHFPSHLFHIADPSTLRIIRKSRTRGRAILSNHGSITSLHTLLTSLYFGPPFFCQLSILHAHFLRFLFAARQQQRQQPLLKLILIKRNYPLYIITL
jgi:hypothetical protein